VMALPFRVPVIAVMRYPPEASGVSFVVNVPLAVIPWPVKFQSHRIDAALAGSAPAIQMTSEMIKIRTFMFLV